MECVVGKNFLFNGTVARFEIQNSHTNSNDSHNFARIRTTSHNFAQLRTTSHNFAQQKHTKQHPPQFNPPLEVNNIKKVSNNNKIGIFDKKNFVVHCKGK